MIPRKIKLTVWEASTLLWMVKRAPEITPMERQVLDLIERRCTAAAERIRKDIDAMSEEGLYVDFETMSGNPASLTYELRHIELKGSLPDIVGAEVWREGK